MAICSEHAMSCLNTSGFTLNSSEPKIGSSKAVVGRWRLYYSSAHAHTTQLASASRWRPTVDVCLLQDTAWWYTWIHDQMSSFLGSEERSVRVQLQAPPVSPERYIMSSGKQRWAVFTSTVAQWKALQLLPCLYATRFANCCNMKAHRCHLITLYVGLSYY
jgi:hypothetical protein